MGTEAIGRDGGGHSGHAAIGEADEQQAGHRRNGPAAAQREEQQQAGKDEAADIGEHGKGVALFIEQRAECQTTEAIADRLQTDDQCRNAGSNAGFHRYVARMTDDTGADEIGADDDEEQQPERSRLYHLAGSIFPAGSRRSGTGRGRHVGIGDDPAAADEQNHQCGRTQQQVSGAPAHGGIEEAIGKIAHDKGATAEAHKQYAGGKALFIREPAHHGAEDGIVGEADAKTDEPAVRNIQQPQALGGNAGTEEIAQEAHHRANEDGNTGGKPAGNKAAGQAADAEAGHDDGEIEAQLRAGPAEFHREGRGEDTPGVDGTGEEEHDAARRQNGRAGREFTLSHKCVRSPLRSGLADSHRPGPASRFRRGLRQIRPGNRHSP